MDDTQQQQPQNPQYPPTPSNLNPMVVLQPGEQVLAELKRHPIGIIGLYMSSFLGLIIASGVVLVLLPTAAKQYGFESFLSIAYGLLGLVILCTVLVLAAATYVYWQNQWIVTTDSITQVSQTSLLGRQTSQLSMDKLEDVTVDRHGLLPTMLNYGTLKVETAGEHSKFQFLYCPNPSAHARQILEAHESFLYRHHQTD